VRFEKHHRLVKFRIFKRSAFAEPAIGEIYTFIEYGVVKVAGLFETGVFERAYGIKGAAIKRRVPHKFAMVELGTFLKARIVKDTAVAKMDMIKPRPFSEIGSIERHPFFEFGVAKGGFSPKNIAAEVDFFLPNGV
jgi:hypothetical protein